jgi:hypothetical protein
MHFRSCTVSFFPRLRIREERELVYRVPGQIVKERGEPNGSNAAGKETSATKHYPCGGRCLRSGEPDVIHGNSVKLLFFSIHSRWMGNGAHCPRLCRSTDGAVASSPPYRSYNFFHLFYLFLAICRSHHRARATRDLFKKRRCLGLERKIMGEGRVVARRPKRSSLRRAEVQKTRGWPYPDGDARSDVAWSGSGAQSPITPPESSRPLHPHFIIQLIALIKYYCGFGFELKKPTHHLLEKEATNRTVGQGACSSCN